MRYKPKRENYANGYYGEIDYNVMLERYCTYLENQNKQLRLHIVSQQRELLICDYEHIRGGGLTLGNKYEKIHEHKGMVVIVNDFDELMNCNKEAFFKAN